MSTALSLLDTAVVQAALDIRSAAHWPPASVLPKSLGRHCCGWPADPFVESLPALREGKGHLLADRHAAPAFQAKQFRLAIDARTENTVDEDVRPSVIAPGRLIVLRMMQAVMLGGVKQEAPPARRVEANIDVLIRSDCRAHCAGNQEGPRHEVEKAADAQADQKELYRVTDRAFVD